MNQPAVKQPVRAGQKITVVGDGTELTGNEQVAAKKLQLVKKGQNLLVKPLGDQKTLSELEDFYDQEGVFLAGQHGELADGTQLEVFNEEMGLVGGTLPLSSAMVAASISPAGAATTAGAAIYAGDMVAVFVGLGIAVQHSLNTSPPPRAAPDTTTPSAEPDTTPPSAEPDTSPPSAEPDTSPPSAEPDTTPPSAEPDTTTPSAEPDTTPPSAEPDTTPPSAEPDTPPPSAEPDTSPPDAPTIAATNRLSISGAAEAGSNVTLKDAAGQLIGTAVANSSGKYTVTPNSPVPNGTALTATATDAAGNASVASASTTVDALAPSLTSQTIGASRADTELPSGSTLKAGDVVTVTATYDDTVVGNLTAQPTLSIGAEAGVLLTAVTTSGNTRTWTYIVSNASTEDTGAISLVGDLIHGLSDAAGNTAAGSPNTTGTFAADTTAPIAAPPQTYIDNVGLTTSNASSALSSDDATPGIDIGVRLIDTPTLYVNGHLTPAVYDDLTGSLTPISPLTASTYSFSYSLTDSTGNTSDFSAPLQIEIKHFPKISTYSYIFGKSNNQESLDDFISTVKQFDIEKIYISVSMTKFTDDPEYRFKCIEDFNYFQSKLDGKQIETGFLVLESPHFSLEVNHDSAINKLNQFLDVLTSFNEENVFSSILLDTEFATLSQWSTSSLDEKKLIVDQYFKLLSRLTEETVPTHSQYSFLSYQGVWVDKFIDPMDSLYYSIKSKISFVLASRQSQNLIAGSIANELNSGFDVVLDLSYSYLNNPSAADLEKYIDSVLGPHISQINEIAVFGLDSLVILPVGINNSVSSADLAKSLHISGTAQYTDSYSIQIELNGITKFASIVDNKWTVEYLPSEILLPSAQYPVNVKVMSPEGITTATDTTTLTFHTNPEVSMVAISSATVNGSGGSNKATDEGDTVTVTVIMDQTVNINTVGGSPTVDIDIGGVTRSATYFGGTGTNQLTFNYTVQNTDFDYNGMAISANALKLNGATVRGVVNGLDASLTHSLVADNSNYLVDAISLGAGNGLLIHGAQAEGNWYFAWDMNGDGQQHPTDNSDRSRWSTATQFHGQTINGITLQTPIAGQTAFATGFNAGTTVADGNTDNTTYDGLLVVWDAHNGDGTTTNVAGIPAGWANDTGYVWSSTSSPSGHAAVRFPTGYVFNFADTNLAYGVYQVF